MKITKQTTKILMEKHFEKDFENFELLLHRKDGKAEAHKVNIEKEQGFYTIEAKLFPNESTYTLKNNFGTFPSSVNIKTISGYIYQYCIMIIFFRILYTFKK